MSTLPPQPARRSYTPPTTSTVTLDDTDYGTPDFLVPEPQTISVPKEAPAESVEVKKEAKDSPEHKSARPDPKPVFSHAHAAPAPVAEPTVAKEAEPEVEAPETAKEIVPARNAATSELHPVAASIDSALHQAPAMIDNAIQQAPVLIGNIVDHYSEQGKKDRLIANALTGSGLATLVTGVFGPQMLVLPFVLAILGLVWGGKARKNGMSTTLSTLMAWTVLGVSAASVAIFAGLAGAAYLFFK